MLDVLIVGAGQAGLAMCWALRGAALSVELVDGCERVGDSWRKRFDSLTLFSPRGASALPGLPLPGDPDGHPTKDEVADYLEAYARWLGARIHLRTRVRRLSLSGERFVAETDGAEVLSARAVVIAAGASQEPIVPPYARALSPEVFQVTAATYRSARQLPDGRVLVAGDGASGRQIALELAGSHDVWLATGRPRLAVPQRILGRDQLWWSQKLGLLRVPRASVLGRLLRRYEPFPGVHLRHRSLRRRGVKIASRVCGARGRTVALSDGTSLDVDAVVWAIGYRERTAWVDVPGATDAHGRFVERRGLAPVRQLYHVGREWQWTRGSALLTGVARDAAFVAERIRRLHQESVARNALSSEAGERGLGIRPGGLPSGR